MRHGVSNISGDTSLGLDVKTNIANDSDPLFGGADPTFLNHHAWSLRWADPVRSAEMANAVLQHSRKAGSTRARGARRRNGLALRTLCWLDGWKGHFDQSEDLAQRAIARLKGEGAHSAIADAYGVLATVHHVRGRRDLAREALKSGFKALAKQDNTSTRIDLLSIQAATEMYGRRLRDAQKPLDEALALSGGPDRARVEMLIGRALSNDNRPGEALEYANRSLHLCKEHNNRVVLPYALEVAATATADLDRLDQALVLLNEANRLLGQLESRRASCHVLYQIVRVHEMKGEVDKALSLVQGGVEIARGMGYNAWEVQFLKRAAELQEASGDLPAALASLKALLQLHQAERE